MTRKGRTTTVDEDFFKSWTRESAWVYGWILTDGSASPASGQVKLMLKRHDREVLEKIRTALNFSGNIYDGEQKDGRTYSYLRICRKNMVDDLSGLGLSLVNKTFSTSMPKMPESLFWDFMRGVTEGDGSLNVKRWGDLSATVCSATEQFLLDLQSTLLSYGINTSMYTRSPGVSGSKNPVYTLTTKSNADALRWCFFMYADTPKGLRLDRKFAIFTNYVRGYYDRNRRSRPCIEAIELIRNTIPECAVTTPTTELLAA